MADPKKLEVQWRPSGGRGEFEYKSDGNVDNCAVTVRIPELEIDVDTDVSLVVKDGKHRLRRAEPNNRRVLNLPSVITVLSGLPKSKREMSSRPTKVPLVDDDYVIHKINFDIVRFANNHLIARPSELEIRGDLGLKVDVSARIRQLIFSNKEPVERLVALLRAHETDASTLLSAASAAHAALPVTFSIEGRSSIETSEVEDDIIEEYVGKEGKERIISHRLRERDPKLSKMAKKLFKSKYKTLFCELCGIDFAIAYPSLGADFIEAHHRTPLSKLNQEVETKPQDLMMVCSNCHRMIHKVPDCNVEVVRAAIQDGELAINAENLAVLKGS
jgi:hypothetical protein